MFDSTKDVTAGYKTFLKIFGGKQFTPTTRKRFAGQFLVLFYKEYRKYKAEFNREVGSISHLERHDFFNAFIPLCRRFRLKSTQEFWAVKGNLDSDEVANLAKGLASLFAFVECVIANPKITNKFNAGFFHMEEIEQEIVLSFGSIKNHIYGVSKDANLTIIQKRIEKIAEEKKGSISATQEWLIYRIAKMF